MSKRRYCPMCDDWFSPRKTECPECGMPLSKPVDEDDIDAEPRRKLTRHERLQGLADRGCDTWDDLRGER